MNHSPKMAKISIPKYSKSAAASNVHPIPSVVNKQLYAKRYEKLKTMTNNAPII